MNVAPNIKDQYVDQVTLNIEREIAQNFSVSATYIYKHSANIFANVPINKVTGQDWEYERIPFTTSTGQTVPLYSIVEKDYNGDGVIDGDDIRWISENNTYRVENMPAFDGHKPKRDYHGLQLVFNKRYSDRWQALASFLYSNSSGVARRTVRQDINVLGPDVLGRQLDGHRSTTRSTTWTVRCPSRPSTSSRCRAPTRSPGWSRLRRPAPDGHRKAHVEA